MIDPGQFVAEIVSPTLERLGLNSLAARRLLLGTAVAESGLVYLRQHRGGPALGLYQIEPATHRDLYNNWLLFKPDWREKALRFAAQRDSGRPDDAQLVTNLAYATAIARLVYYRRPEPLPRAENLQGLARYWKDHFNTAAGAGTPAYFLAKAGTYLKEVI